MVDFHVVIWRDGLCKLGLTVGVDDDRLFILSVYGTRIVEMNMRCRTSRVEEILGQQLLVKDC